MPCDRDRTHANNNGSILNLLRAGAKATLCRQAKEWVTATPMSTAENHSP